MEANKNKSQMAGLDLNALPDECTDAVTWTDVHCSALEDNVSLEDVIISKKPCRASCPAPLDVSELRRSSRRTRFQGFKSPSVVDHPRRRPLVKPHHSPSAAAGPHLPLAAPRTASPSAPAPPPPSTTIPLLQHIGVSYCSISASERSDECLVQAPSTDDDGNPT
ncbi:uncharacterized protein [Triticum aestivum]|uniref:uncharacterized protein n=1 Tax=Triticum aestivum TaxID=4565 RepID=UPI001D00A78C|nr:uncharacterized protein LOC123099490 [Triticum aestivum]